MRFLNSAEKCKRGDPLGFFNIHCVENIGTSVGEALWWNPKKNQKKSHSAEKNPSEKHQRVDPMFSRFWTSMFLLWTGSGVSSMLWTSVVQVDDVEQRNKKVDRSR